MNTNQRFFMHDYFDRFASNSLGIAPPQNRLSAKQPVRKDSVVEDNVEQRLMDADASVVLDKAQLAETIHEKADA